MAGWIEEGPRLNGQPVVLSFYRIVVRPGPNASRKDTQVENLCYGRRETHRLTTCATGDSEGLPAPRSRR
jgi:hypothetical protein